MFLNSFLDIDFRVYKIYESIIRFQNRIVFRNIKTKKFLNVKYPRLCNIEYISKYSKLP